ncbi:MAG: hypothetical protein ABJC87_05600, partial [Roseobacter sp.]
TVYVYHEIGQGQYAVEMVRNVRKHWRGVPETNRFRAPLASAKRLFCDSSNNGFRRISMKTLRTGRTVFMN